MEDWRLIITCPYTGAMNMAVDEAILLAVARGTVPPTIRFYQWSKPTITLGYFQSYYKEVDPLQTVQQDVDVVRRLTGGRAVLHHRELTYSLIAPENNQVVKGSVLQAYLAVSAGLVGGLREIGIPAEIAAGKLAKGCVTAACFDSPSRYEVVVSGKKLVGSAQTRRNHCILQHGSVVIEKETDLLFSCLCFATEEAREKGKHYFVQKAASLADILGYPPEFQQIADALTVSFAAKLGINLKLHHLSPSEMSEAYELCRSKYGTDIWNKKR